METATQELANPVLNDTDAKEAESILSALKEQDESQGLSSSDAQPEQRVPETTTQPEVEGEHKPDSPETKPETEKQERKRDAQGRFLKQDGSVDPDQTEPAQPEIKPDAKPTTPYAKAAKDAERLDKSWKALEAEKAQARAQVEAERRLIEAQKAEIERQRTAPRISPDGRNGYTAEQYVEAAREYRIRAKAHLDVGNIEEAKQFDDLAEKAQIAANEAWTYETQLAQQRQRETFAAKYQTNLKAEFDKDPELQNPEAPIHKYLGQLLESEPYFGQTEDGFAKAKQVAKWQMDSELVSGLREENTKLKAEVERLTKATSLTSSGPTAPPSTKKFEDKSLDEMGADLRETLANMPALV